MDLSGKEKMYIVGAIIMFLVTGGYWGQRILKNKKGNVPPVHASAPAVLQTQALPAEVLPVEETDLDAVYIEEDLLKLAQEKEQAEKDVWERNPFMPTPLMITESSNPNDSPGQLQSAPEAVKSLYNLTGVIRQKSGKDIILIDNVEVSEGDEISGAFVKKITKTEVLLQKGDEEIIVKIPK